MILISIVGWFRGIGVIVMDIFKSRGMLRMVFIVMLGVDRVS